MVSDSALQRGLLQALLQEGAASVRQVVARDLAFDDATRQAQAAIAPTATTKAVSRIDLFWCEASGPRQQQVMQTVRGQMVQHGFPDAGVRVRVLPASVNSRPGYNVTGYEVRFEADERDVARQIQQAVQQATGAGAAPVTLRLIAAQTPGYVSAFACP